MPQVQYRTATPHDVSDILDIMCDAPDDGITYMYRQFSKDREGIRRRFLKYFRHAMLDPTILWRLAVDVDIDDDGADSKPARKKKERIIAFSGWMRKEFPSTASASSSSSTKDPQKDPEKGDKHEEKTQVHPRKLRQNTWVDTLNATLLLLESHYDQALTRLRPTPNPYVTASLRDSLNKHRHALQPSPDMLEPCWDMCGLAIRPEYQGMGIGTTLVRWGMQRAEDDGVVLFTGGETTGFDFYVKKLGFRPVEGSQFWLDKDGNDVEGGEQGDGWKKEKGGVKGGMLVWDPKWKKEKEG